MKWKACCTVARLCLNRMVKEGVVYWHRLIGYSMENGDGSFDDCSPVGSEFCCLKNLFMRQHTNILLMIFFIIFTLNIKTVTHQLNQAGGWFSYSDHYRSPAFPAPKKKKKKTEKENQQRNSQKGERKNKKEKGTA